MRVQRKSFLIIFVFFMSVALNRNAFSAAPVISNISHTGTGNKFEKYEISFDVSSDVTDLNPFFPYINTFDASQIPGVDVYAEKGITVNGKLQYKGLDGNTEGEPIYITPAFYYETQNYDVSKNVTGANWIYPTGESEWKVRFSPDQNGTWEFTIEATDAEGTTESLSDTFVITSGTNEKGFIKVSTTNSKYFEYENGQWFKGLGYHLHTDDHDAITDSAITAATMGNNGMDLARFWLSGWSLFGGQWAPPYNELAYEDGYLPYQTYNANHSDADSELSIRMGYYASGNPGNSPMCLVWGWQSPRIAVEGNTTYKFTLKYKTVNVTTIGTGGLVVKTAPWIDLVRDTCTNPDNGTEITGYVTGTSSTEFETISGEITTTSNQKYLDNIYVTLDNVTGGNAYIDSLKVEKLDGPGGNVLFEINSDYKADQHVYYNQRDAFAFDKMLENFENNGVSLKVVLLEKMDKITRQYLPDGTWGIAPEHINLYGDPSNPRDDTKVRWLQKAWWRYVQARWGYSTSIHSYELLNEGDPASSLHFALTDEFGKYLKCTVFGASVGAGDAQTCTYDHPNHHMVTTSTWHSFPSYWSNANYPNIDYADLHQYIAESSVGNFVYNKFPSFVQHRQPAFSSIDLGNSTVSNIGKPVVRGEVGFTNSGTEPYDANMDDDLTGLWLHDFIWGQLNSGGVMDQYWYSEEQISSQSVDFNDVFLGFSKFIGEENLNNGEYAEINFTNATVSAGEHAAPNPLYNQMPATIDEYSDLDDVIVTGLKDDTNGRAVLWVKNIHNNWCVEVGDCLDEPHYNSVPYNFDLTLTGFSPNESYTLEKWDAWNGFQSNRSEQILSSSTVVADGSGDITIAITGLSTEAAYKIIAEANVLIGDVNEDGTVNLLDYVLLSNAFGTADVPSDLNDDGTVNLLDYVLLSNNFGQSL